MRSVTARYCFFVQTRREDTSRATPSAAPAGTADADVQAAERILTHGRFVQPREALHELETVLRGMSPDAPAVLTALYGRALLLRLVGAGRADQVAACTMLESAAVHHGSRPDAEVWIALACALRARARLESGEAAAAMGDLARIDLTALADRLDDRVGFRLLDAAATAFARIRMADKVEQIREQLDAGVAERDLVDRATHWATWSAELAAGAMEPVARGAAEPDPRLLERAVRIARRVVDLGLNAVPQPLRRTADGVLALSAAFAGHAQEALRLLGSDGFGEPIGLNPPESQLLVIAALHAHTLVGSHVTARSLDDSIARSTGAIPNIVLEICRARQRIWLDRESGVDPERGRQRLIDLLVRLGWAGLELSTETARQAMEHQVLHTESRTDSVTGVGNRRALDEELHAMLRFSPLPLSMVLVDIDDFKQVNDDHTHVVGDEVLRTVAGILDQTMPADARLLRYGGDEFVVLVPRVGDAEAHRVADAMVAAVAGYPWGGVAAGLRIRATAGCAALWALTGRRPTADAARLFRRADESLLEAKRAARAPALPTTGPRRSGDNPAGPASTPSASTEGAAQPATEVLDLRDLSTNGPTPARTAGRRSHRRDALIDVSDTRERPDQQAGRTGPRR